jgi:hypothetical protein
MNGGRIVTKNREFKSSTVFGDRPHLAFFGQHWANIVTVMVLGLCAFVYIKTNVLAPLPGLRSQSDFAHPETGRRPFEDQGASRH